MPSIDELLDQAIVLARSRRRVPGATYRLQLHAGFPIPAARRIVPYLHALGITHIYTSSLLTARPGSLHGYDVIHHDALNPELGTEEEFRAWVADLRGRGMGLILDVVPNHMCVSGDNAWWNDVLENGPSSPFAGYFDIAWRDHPRDRLHDKVLLPVLGEPYGTMLEAGRIRLVYRQGGFQLEVHDRVLPVDPRTYGLILGPALEEAKSTCGATAEPVSELLSILTAVSHLPPRTETDAERIALGRVEAGVIRRRLDQLLQAEPMIASCIEASVARINGTPGDPASFSRLDELLDAQAYRLSYWRVASDEINYRRFFDVNDLAALSTEREEVFEATHRKIFEWLGEGLIDGVRIDHPDGLYDPKQYLDRLQLRYLIACAEHIARHREAFASITSEEIRAAIHARFSSQPLERWLYVVVEKILGPGELLPADWLTDGTTGYELLNHINALFVDTARESETNWNYERFTGLKQPFSELVYRSKFLVLQSSLASELHMLAHQLDRLAQMARWSRDFTLNTLRHALREVIACFPVYRTYIRDSVSETDLRNVARACRQARLRNPTLGRAVFDFIRDTLLLKDPPSGPASPEYRAAQQRFAGKFQQVTAPVTAKGFEDTALYIYNRLVSLNEVGGDPGRFGLPPARVHLFFRDRCERHPAGLSPLSTHDTKRSEDVRARLNLLSEIPDLWAERLGRWHEMNAAARTRIDDDTIAPDPNEEYLLYQTLVGVWPMVPPPPEHHTLLTRRIQAYMNKAIHEAKIHTSWINPDLEYDAAVDRFVEAILADAEFLGELTEFVRFIGHWGAINSLAQTLIRCTAPGIPDTYQGTEIFELSLVDPDNRRPVDFDRRMQRLAQVQAGVTQDRSSWAGRAGQELPEEVKLYVLSETLRQRQAWSALFLEGAYEPIDTVGPLASHLFAFLRHDGTRATLTVVPRLVAAMARASPQLASPVGADLWRDTQLTLPEAFRCRRWVNVFTGKVVEDAQTAAEVLADFPVALLRTEE